MFAAELNGYLLCDKLVPDIALENILAFVPVNCILKLRKVCQVWRDITTRRTFWKAVAERNGIDWSSIPERFKENENSWIILYTICRHRILHKNYILNHSGHDQFNHWQKLQDNADRILVESPPLGISPLPTDPHYLDATDSAFVFSYDWGIMQQKVNLRQAGLTTETLRSLIPFQFVATQMTGTRFDCGGCYCVCLCLLNDRGQAVTYNITDNLLPAGDNWTQSSVCLNVTQDLGLNEVRHLAILICGKDTQYWAGHYGTKFSRISVTLKCLSPLEAESVAPHAKTVGNRENAHLFIGSLWNNLLPNRPVGRCPYRHGLPN